MSTFLQCLEGELLGDASLLVPTRGTNAVFQVQTKYKGQVYFAFATLHQLGGNVHSFVRKLSGFNTKPRQMYQWRSHVANWLTNEWRRWYVNGVKIVPVDFVLTPTSALHWYIGDGSLHKQNPRIVLCTDNFDDLSIGRLLRQLRINGFHPRERKSTKGKPRIELGVDDVAGWLAWIGPCPVPELQHKWSPTFRVKRNQYLSAEEHTAICNMKNDGMSYSGISHKLQRSYHTIYSVLNGTKYR